MKIKLSALAAVLAFSVSAHAATVDYDAGDLVMSFYTKSGTGSTLNVSVGLGDLATAFRGDLNGGSVLTGSTYWTSNNNGTFTFNLGTALGTVLDNAFGIGWYNRSDLYWGISGVLTSSATASAVGGDPRRTVYVSHDASAASYSGLGTSTVASVATNMTGFQGAFDTLQADSGQTLVATYQDSISNSYESWQYNGDSRLADWGYVTGANSTVSTTLAVDRILALTNGANPTGTVGNGQSIGTFSLGSDGTLTFSAVPEPSTYGLLIGGLLTVGFMMWKRRRVANA